MEPLRDPSVFVNTLRDSSSPTTYKDIKAVRFGDNIVDYYSIHVDLAFITVDKYPEKPTLKSETGEHLVRWLIQFWQLIDYNKHNFNNKLYS